MIKPIMNIFSRKCIIPPDNGLHISISSSWIIGRYGELNTIMDLLGDMIFNKESNNIFLRKSMIIIIIRIDLIIPSNSSR